MEHSKHHTHECTGSCGCGHKHDHAHAHETPVTSEAQALLQEIAKSACLPVVRFVFHSTKSKHFEAVALAPVHLYEAETHIEQVKAHGAQLRQLEAAGLLCIDYTQPSADLDYTLYQASTVYRLFQEMVAEASTHAEFLYDSGEMECGSMRVTQEGRAMIDGLPCEHKA